MDKKLNFTDISDFFAKAVGVSAAEGEAFPVECQFCDTVYRQRALKWWV